MRHHWRGEEPTVAVTHRESADMRTRNERPNPSTFMRGVLDESPVRRSNHRLVARLLSALFRRGPPIKSSCAPTHPNPRASEVPYLRITSSLKDDRPPLSSREERRPGKATAPPLELLVPRVTLEASARAIPTGGSYQRGRVKLPVRHASTPQLSREESRLLRARAS